MSEHTAPQPGQGYFSRVELRHDSAIAGRLIRTLRRDGYRLHQSLWRLFEAEGITGRDYLYRAIGDADWPGFYVVSRRPPQDRERLWRLRVKDYAPALTAGDRLAFSLRANPIVTRRQETGGRPSRHDVVMDAKKRGVLDRADSAGPYYRPGLGWLGFRAEKHGFRVEKVRIDGYRQHRYGNTKGRHIAFSTLDFDGVLTVTDPASLLQALFNGIGPAKAFGCGLLLVRRI